MCISLLRRRLPVVSLMYWFEFQIRSRCMSVFLVKNTFFLSRLHLGALR